MTPETIDDLVELVRD